jgi:hypothetical protein
MKRLLQSFGIGIFTIVSLYLIGMFGAAHQDITLIGGIGYIAFAIIDSPLMMLYGADPRQPPPLLVSIAFYLAEAAFIALFAYLALSARKKQK